MNLDKGKMCEPSNSFLAKVSQSQGTWVSKSQGKSGNLAKKIGKPVTEVQKDLLCCNYSPSFENFSVLMTESNGVKLKTIENLLIVHNKPVLNKVDPSLPLELF